MRLSPMHSRYTNVRSARIALAAAAVAGLVVIAACTDSAGKSITAPPSAPRNATIENVGFANAGKASVCIAAGSPAGTYKFTNSNFLGMLGGGGGNGTSIENAADGTEYTVAVGACQQVITRSTPDNIFCDGGVYPNFPGCVAVDSYAGVVVTVSTMPGGVTYNHTDCSLDQGVKFPKDALGVSNTLNGGGNPCGTNNNPSTIFANIAHGMELTFFFNTPTGHNCTFTQGYYKNHESYTASVLSSNAGTTYIDATGKLLIGPYALTAAQVDAILGADVGHGYNTGGVVFTKDQLSMIHQLITAELNIAGGAAPATIVAIVTAANNYAGATKTQLSNWTDALDDFNKGSNGPNHCK